MAKGDFPYWLNGDGTVKEEFREDKAEIKERRHWKAFWDELPPWLKTPLMLILTALAASYGTKQFNTKDDFMNEDDWRKVVREEIGPLKAGFKAFVASQPASVQVKILQAMAKQEEKQKETP